MPQWEPSNSIALLASNWVLAVIEGWDCVFALEVTSGETEIKGPGSEPMNRISGGGSVRKMLVFTFFWCRECPWAKMACALCRLGLPEM